MLINNKAIRKSNIAFSLLFHAGYAQDDVVLDAEGARGGGCEASDESRVVVVEVLDPVGRQRGPNPLAGADAAPP
jgi:hypothetical protein